MGNPRVNCKICDTNSAIEIHHIIPRAYGGEHGDVIELCAVCHSSIHSAAIAKIGGTLTNAHFGGTLKCNLQLSRRLVTIIETAHNHIKDDPNKTVMLSIRLSAEHNRKLEVLKHAMGLKSKPDALLTLIDIMHSKL